MSQWILAPHWCPHQTDSKFPVNHSSVKSPDLVFPCTPSGNVSYRRIYNKIISLHPNEQVVLLINVVLNPENCCYSSSFRLGSVHNIIILFSNLPFHAQYSIFAQHRRGKIPLLESQIHISGVPPFQSLL